MSLRLAFLGCHRAGFLAAGDAIANVHRCAALFLQGDTPYIDDVVNDWEPTDPVDLTQVAGGGSVAQIRQQYDSLYANPGYQEVFASATQVYAQMDDHECLGNDWDHGAAAAGAGNALTPNANQAERNTHWGNCRQTFVEVNTTGPNRVLNTPAHADGQAGEVPPQVQTGAFTATDYDPLYFRIGFQADGTIIENPTGGQLAGLLAQAYVSDTMSHRDLWAAPDTPTKYQLGAVQRQWLKDQMDAFQAANADGFHLWVCAKNLVPPLQDSWRFYPDELAWIQANILDGSITGLIHISNDTHRAFAGFDPANPVLAVCYGGAGQTLGQYAAVSTADDVIWFDTYPDGATWRNSYGLVTIDDDALVLEIRWSGIDTVWKSWRIRPDSNDYETVT